MDKNLSIERRLTQLVPASVSGKGQIRLDEMVDKLAGIDTSSGSITRGFIWKAAAALALLAIPAVMLTSNRDSLKQVANTKTPVHLPEMLLIKSSNRIEARENDGLIIPVDGSSPHYRYRYHIIDEEELRDTQTGTVVTLRQPRYEVLTVPIVHF